jgi:hypothetical protein
MVAYQQEHRNAGVGDPLDPPRKLALVGGVWIARLVGVAGKDEDVHPLVDGVVGKVAEPAQEVHHAGVDPGGGIYPPVVFHTDMNVGGVQ